MSKSPDITVYFLGASRAIRVPWMLEELGIDYKLVSSPRAPNGVAPPEFREKIPAPLKKSPTIKDGDLVVQESGAIIQYLCETYDTAGRFLPKDPATRVKIYEWMHAAEGTFGTHGLAVLYSRWQMPDEGQKFLPELEQKLSNNVNNDFRWIESALKESGHRYLVGEELTVADIMMQFMVEFMTTRKLGVDASQYPETMDWLKRTMERPAYKRAVEKTGYTLDSKGKFRT